MPSKTALNAKTLAALGAPRLAELLIELTERDATMKRRLRLELAGTRSAGEVVREISKRLKTVARSQSFIEWHQVKTIVQDLEMQRRVIAEQVAKADPAAALDLMWDFLALANSVLARCDDSNGAVGEVFRSATGNLGDIAEVANPPPKPLADRIFSALTANDYGQYDELIGTLSPYLQREGLDHLKAQFLEVANTPIPKPAEGERKVIGWGSGGPLYKDEYAERRRDITIRLALQQIADAQGDVDAFISQQSETARTVPIVASEIARRLLDAGRAEDALSAIDAVEERGPGRIPLEWEVTRIAVLEALGRNEEAQAFRWACFERSLTTEHLRAYIKHLPDFDDIEAEERALTIALGFRDHHAALDFLVSWPSLDKASELVLRRAAQWNGDYYEYLSPATDALHAKHPLAATILRRAMIDFTLSQGRSKRYRHAARHLIECASLAGAIADFGSIAAHAPYVAGLKAQHGRKSGFWGLL